VRLRKITCRRTERGGPVEASKKGAWGSYKSCFIIPSRGWGPGVEKPKNDREPTGGTSAKGDDIKPQEESEKGTKLAQLIRRDKKQRTKKGDEKSKQNKKKTKRWEKEKRQEKPWLKQDHYHKKGEKRGQEKKVYQIVLWWGLVIQTVK